MPIDQDLAAKFNRLTLEDKRTALLNMIALIQSNHMLLTTAELQQLAPFVQSYSQTR
jgi:NADH:ubiquinone oxidoreductase subunit E